MIPLALLWRYFRTRKLHFTDREALENWQAKRLHQFRQNVLSHSPWFQRYLTLPFNQWPMMDKALMMTHFDEMNTAGLKRDELLDCAMRSEQSRDFKPCVGRFSVGLSSGTSGRRGLFVVSPHEQQMWAAGVLAKVLPDGLFAKERVVPPAGVERYISTKSLFTLNRNGWMSTVSCRSSQTLPAPHSR